MVKTAFLLIATLTLCECGAREFVVARDGVAACRIVRDAESLNDVRFATHDLTNHLARMTGVSFETCTAAGGVPAIECGTDRARAAALAAA